MKALHGKHLYLAIGLLIVGIVLTQRVPHGKTMPLQKDILTFEQQIGSWKAGPHKPFEQNILDVLRVDEYLNRIYYDEGGRWISLYIGYFADQLSGKTIHSPRNCMPGSGWNFTQQEAVTIESPGDRPMIINAMRAVLVSGEERMLTYYWYQSRGRFLTDEYWHKIYLVVDAMRYQRTDGALVRVLAPIPKGADIDALDTQLQEFIMEFTPKLQNEYFPPAVGKEKGETI